MHDTTFILHVKDMRLLLNVCYQSPIQLSLKLNSSYYLTNASSKLYTWLVCVHSYSNYRLCSLTQPRKGFTSLLPNTGKGEKNLEKKQQHWAQFNLKLFCSASNLIPRTDPYSVTQKVQPPSHGILLLTSQGFHLKET